MGLIPSLRARGFKVKTIPKQGLKDPEIQHDIEGEIIVTYNVNDFKYDAIQFDYDIIDLSAVKFKDSSPEPTNRVATLISRAIIDTKISSLKGNFILHIRPDGETAVQLLG